MQRFLSTVSVLVINLVLTTPYPSILKDVETDSVLANNNEQEFQDSGYIPEILKRDTKDSIDENLIEDKDALNHGQDSDGQPINERSLQRDPSVAMNINQEEILQDEIFNATSSSGNLTDSDGQTDVESSLGNVLLGEGTKETNKSKIKSQFDEIAAFAGFEKLLDQITDILRQNNIFLPDIEDEDVMDVNGGDINSNSSEIIPGRLKIQPKLDSIPTVGDGIEHAIVVFPERACPVGYARDLDGKCRPTTWFDY